MPHLTTDDGVKLYYEETGRGTPIVFIHEFAGDHRSWEQQVRYFARYYRCITVNARGYPPSDVPKDGGKYSQDRARDDIRGVLDTIKVPTLIMTGDEDWPCIEPGVLMKKNISTAALVVMPNAGHNINLEDPSAFNAHLAELFLAADAGTWPVRDPRAMAGSILGK